MNHYKGVSYLNEEIKIERKLATNHYTDALHIKYYFQQQHLTNPDYYMMLSKAIKFWLLLVFLIPSIICSLFVLYYLLFNRTLRHALNNHVIIVVVIIGLICEVTIYPWMLYYYQHEGIWQISLIFCEIWGFIDWGLYLTHTILVSWATIERHILIFHNGWISTKKKRFFIHYLPLISLLLYCLVFNSIIIFFPFCENSIYDDDYACLDFCFYKSRVLGLWQTIFHQIIPNLIIVVISMALLVRILWQKYQIHRTIQWRKHRKMAVQLLSISFLYLIFSFPLTMIYVLYFFDPSYYVNHIFLDTANYFSYYMILILPFVCILSFSELRTKFNKLLHLRRTRVIHPAMMAPRAVPNNLTHIY